MIGENDWGSLGDALDEEFACEAIVTPVVARPNMRPGPDPSRPSYSILGIFHEAHKIAGDNKRDSDGLHETHVTTVAPYLSVAQERFDFPPSQGDLIEIPAQCRTFRVADIQYEMRGRVRLVLELIRGTSK